ncbi:MAG TPA: TorF family putative porin [Draconibacterium sp.]|nr:TorF family putative porin [Draconibacterium sp.]
MKKTLLITASMLLMVTLFVPAAKAQEWSTGLDIYSSYIWRGAKFGSGPAFQPTVEFSAGGFAIGAWGSVSASTDEALEMDLYAGYTFELGESSSLGLTLTDYYFGGDWTDGDYHFFEPLVSLGLGDFSLTGAYMFYDGAGTDGDGSGDLYLEAAYSFGSFDLTLGGGNGQYTDDTKFKVCNISVGTSKEVAVTETFTLPVSGAVILNPSTGGFFITVGISL